MAHAAEEIIEAANSIIESPSLSEVNAAELTDAVDEVIKTVHYWAYDFHCYFIKLRVHER